jgi:hypothetical protein
MIVSFTAVPIVIANYRTPQCIIALTAIKEIIGCTECDIVVDASTLENSHFNISFSFAAQLTAFGFGLKTANRLAKTELFENIHMNVTLQYLQAIKGAFIQQFNDMY